MYKKDVQQMVRKLQTRIPEGQEHILNQVELYYDGVDKFQWFRKGEEPFGWRRMWVPLDLAYIRVLGEGLKRKNLGELDEMFYEAINNSKESKRRNMVNNFKGLRLGSISRRMKYLRVSLVQGRRSDYLSVRLDITREPINEEYKGLTVKEMGDQYQNFIIDNRYKLQGFYGESKEGMMVILISEDYVKYWDEFLKVAVDFDQKLQNK